MTSDTHRIAAAIIAILAILAALWLLLFVGPLLLNAHRDDAALLAVLLYLGVPASLAWGCNRVRRLLDPEDHCDD